MIGGIVKWVAILGIVSTIGYGLNRAYEYHLDQIDLAVVASKLETAIEEQKLASDREDLLREKSRQAREAIEIELQVERARVSDLQKQLLIDHDLDRLLQIKPGLILTIANEGTEKVLLELEELTQ